MKRSRSNDSNLQDQVQAVDEDDSQPAMAEANQPAASDEEGTLEAAGNESDTLEPVTPLSTSREATVELQSQKVTSEDKPVTELQPSQRSADTPASNSSTASSGYQSASAPCPHPVSEGSSTSSLHTTQSSTSSTMSSTALLQLSGELGQPSSDLIPRPSSVASVSNEEERKLSPEMPAHSDQRHVVADQHGREVN